MQHDINTISLNTHVLNGEAVRPPHIVVDVDTSVAPADSDPLPPPFAPYNPKFFVSGDGDVISHDHHLNEDGEALYRFLLAQSTIPPTFLLSVLGTHKERRTRTVTTTNPDGTTRSTIQRHTVTVTDFSFHIDLTSYIVHGPVFWSHPDEAAAYRGLMVRQVNTPTRRKATGDEVNIFKSEEYTRLAAGLAPWQHLDGSVSLNREPSSKSPRDWADEYAASPKLLKEFVYEKLIYGWNTAKLTEAISNAVAQTSYTGNVESTFTLSNSKICIRPDNRLSRTLSSTLYKVLLIITFIYPFIWLFKRFGSRGGGRWEVVGAAYALREIESLDGPPTSSEIQLESTADAITESRHACRIPRVIETANGLQKLIGYREGEWFKEWEHVIKRCAATRLRASEPLKSIRDAPVDPMNRLEGYAPENLEGY